MRPISWLLNRQLEPELKLEPEPELELKSEDHFTSGREAKVVSNPLVLDQPLRPLGPQISNSTFTNVAVEIEGDFAIVKANILRGGTLITIRGDNALVVDNALYDNSKILSIDSQGRKVSIGGGL